MVGAAVVRVMPLFLATGVKAMDEMENAMYF
jgi:hypothetical protein